MDQERHQSLCFVTYFHLSLPFSPLPFIFLSPVLHFPLFFHTVFSFLDLVLPLLLRLFSFFLLFYSFLFLFFSTLSPPSPHYPLQAGSFQTRENTLQSDLKSKSELASSLKEEIRNLKDEVDIMKKKLQVCS